MLAVQFIAVLVTPKAIVDAPHRLNLKYQLAKPKTTQSQPLNIRGVYRLVRDPFSASGYIIMIFTPFMTVNLLIVYIIAAIYMYIGSLHMEKRLVKQFGDEYKEYQKNIHRLIPTFNSKY
ncbi:methyltransferase family protein [Methanococcoides burtonii]|uniref:methyltransferase family protein n=1 Tax=Methanococcoides burtonii TaxID=29291 RepID=UPI0000540530|nr:isoprenylcysteine carboxylmethyltransferase family protein [Methanococcoides burtonii]